MIARIGKLQFRIYFSTLEKRKGICSQKDTNEDLHALLIDFDNSELSDIVKSLRLIQIKYHLPTIFVLKSSPHSYHAYCFTARPFMKVIHILSDIPEIDKSYFRLGIVRGYFTLRITPRKGEKFGLIKTLASIYPPEMSPKGLTINEYLTSNKGKGGRRHAKG